MDIVIVVALVVIAVLSIRLVAKSREGKLNYIHGPKGRPIIGNLLDVRATSTASRVVTLEKWAKQYGPVFRVRVFARELIFVSGYDELIEMLVTKGAAFGAKPQHYRLRMLFHGKDVLFGTPADPQWLPLRKVGQWLPLLQ